MTDRPPTSADELLTHAPWVRRLACKLVIDPSMADDVEQQTWLRVLQAQREQRAERVARIERPRAWLAGIARNVRSEIVRGDARRQHREEDVARPEALPAADELVERAELQTRVARAVLELDEPFRSALLLRYFEEKSPEEIAKRLGLPGSTVRNRLARGLARLRERFDREDGDRRTWVRALLPLALGVRSDDLAALLAGGSSAATASVGGTSMLIKGTILTVALLGLGVGAKLGADAWHSPALDALHERHAALAGELRPEGHDAPAVHGTRPTRRAPAVERVSEVPSPAEIDAMRETARIAGRVVDTDGTPVAGAAVFLGGTPSPFDPGRSILATRGDQLLTMDVEKLEHVEQVMLEGKSDLAIGKLYATLPDGTFFASPDDEAWPGEGPERIYVTFPGEPGLRQVRAGAWHDLPAKDIELVVRRVPMATLEISVRDKRSTQRLSRFVAEIVREGQPPLRLDAGQELVAVPVELPPEESHRVTVRITEPLWARTSTALDLTPGRDVAVELEVDPGLDLRGLVVDAEGAPVQGALVYWGPIAEMRADPMAGYEPDRVLGGVRTDASGWFRLPGNANEGELDVTVWHERHSPTSVGAAEATFIEMPPRGTVRGRLLDNDGRPVVGSVMHIDRKRACTTDEDGLFVIENVEAGVHGLIAKVVDAPWIVGIDVPAGGELVFERRPAFPASVELTSGGERLNESFGGVLVGFDNPFAVARWDAVDGVAELEALPHGRYALLAFDGRIGEVELRGAPATCELGTSDLTIVARPGTKVDLAPESYAANAAIDFMGNHTSRTVPASGELVYGPLQDGRYRLRVQGELTSRTVVVQGRGSRTSLLE